MAKKILGGLALAAGLIVLLVVVYQFYSGGPSQVGPGKPEAPGEPPYRTAPEFAEKSTPPGLGAPPSQIAPAPVQPAPPVEAPPKPEVSPPAAQVTPSPPLEPEEYYGLLVRRYRTYKEASRVMEKLKKEGKPAFVRHDGRKRKPYEVWVGPFPKEQEAQLAAKSIRKKLKVSPKLEKLQLPVPK